MRRYGEQVRWHDIAGPSIKFKKELFPKQTYTWEIVKDRKAYFFFSYFTMVL